MDKQDIVAEHRHCGAVWVRGMNAYGAVVPRVVLNLGISLDFMEADRPGTKEFSEYEVREIYGELRLSEHADAVCMLTWGVNHNGPYCHRTNTDSQMELIGTIDPWVLERIEAWRNGKPPVFWVKVWPSLGSDKNGWYKNVSVGAIKYEMPTDKWLAVLKGLGYWNISILEVPFDDRESARFTEALVFLGRARQAFMEGRYQECIGAARGGLERLAVHTKDGRSDPLVTFLTETHEQHAAEIMNIYNAVKELGNKGVHTTREFTRAEAQFVFQTASHLVSLFGSLTTKRVS